MDKKGIAILIHGHKAAARDLFSKEVARQLARHPDTIFENVRYLESEDADAVGKELEKDDVFIVPLAKGLRVSVASISEEKCRILPAKIQKALQK